MSKRRLIQIIIAVGLALLIIGLVGCAEKSGPNQVIAENLAFIPQTLTVSEGTMVTWVNRDNTTHQPMADNGEFTSPIMNPGDKFSFKFNRKGVFKYHCDLHPYMKAEIIVE